ncbi:hypothetical protein [Phyllobacterium sophorae]|uniref:hypothetical protein n=1 Tax=Phyllobacterium sophorae TaxID=1520277 RepID=UPI000D1134CD
MEKGPDEENGRKHQMCKSILLKCLEGGCPTAVARVAFVEAARDWYLHHTQTALGPLGFFRLHS